MKRVMLAFAIAMFTLIFTTAAFTDPGKATANSSAAASPQELAIQITNQKGKAVKLESLPAKDQEHIQRFRKAAQNLRDSGELGSPQDFRIRVSCQESGGGWDCTIVISWGRNR